MIQPKPSNWRRDVRGPAFAETPLAAGLTVLACFIAGVMAAQVPAFMPSGANLSDPAQADYARNIWSSDAPIRAAVAFLCPLVVYSLLPPFMTGARKALLPVSFAALCVASGFAAEAIHAYGQPPVPVNGAVTSFVGREISQCGMPSHHVIVSDSELRQAHNWIKSGTAVVLYLTQAGDAAYIGPAQADWPCVTSALGS